MQFEIKQQKVLVIWPLNIIYDMRATIYVTTVPPTTVGPSHRIAAEPSHVPRTVPTAVTAVRRRKINANFRLPIAMRIVAACAIPFAHMKRNEQWRGRGW